MLASLLIKNYALIKHLQINFGEGLNIITGETGAGKSIMLGALGLLMGNRADVKSLFDEQEKCVVEGTFNISGLHLSLFFEQNDLDYEDISIIRREIAPNGKSRAFINDSPVNLETLKSLGVFLMDIHSQHDTLLLATSNFQLGLVDAYAQNQELLNSYHVFFSTFKNLDRQYLQLKSNALEIKKEFDYNSFLLEELTEAKLSVGEQENLEFELSELENAEELKRKLSLAFGYLNHPELSALSMLRDANAALGGIAGISEKYKTLKQRFNSSLIEFQDLTDEIEATESKVEINEAQLALVRDRLNFIFKLQSKHGVKSIEELLKIEADLQQKVTQVASLEEQLIEIEKERASQLAYAQGIGQKLTQARQGAIPGFVKNIALILADLGMPDAQMEVSQKTKELGSDGADEIQMGFSANKGSAPKSLKDVASGGEFSRLMLAIKYILAEKRQLPTLIFDEIDAGISGEVALKVGAIMTEMAKKLQVLAITHLHQIAGRGKTHFYVYKDRTDSRTVSLMRQLSNEERIIEVAKMIGGEKPSESALASAKEMLEI
jgi:DNA repair protein RecN (Recombination protein N)